MRAFGLVIASVIVFSPVPAKAAAVYWNLYNLEGESSSTAVFATYATLDDMLMATNELATYTPLGAGVTASRNVVGTGSDGTTFWNLYNLEGESSNTAISATYTTLGDMLTASSELATYSPLGAGVTAFRNVVGTGSDGTTYWNLFNKEGESSLPAVFATYASLEDMLTASNELATYSPLGSESQLRPAIFVGTGSDGTTYWNLFNVEGESSLTCGFCDLRHAGGYAERIQTGWGNSRRPGRVPWPRGT